MRVGDYEQFRIGLGGDCRADVTPVEHGAAGLRREIALEGEEGLSDPGVNRNLAGQNAHFGAEQVFGFDCRGIEVLGGFCGQRLDVGGIDMGFYGQTDGAIEQARIEMGQVKVLAQRGGDGALARGRRSIHRDNHAASSLWENPAPRRVKSASKLGKDVAIIRSSSTVTGFSAASPMTRKLMAMR